MQYYIWCHGLRLSSLWRKKLSSDALWPWSKLSVTPTLHWNWLFAPQHWPIWRILWDVACSWSPPDRFVCNFVESLFKIWVSWMYNLVNLPVVFSAGRWTACVASVNDMLLGNPHLLGIMTAISRKRWLTIRSAILRIWLMGLFDLYVKQLATPSFFPQWDRHTQADQACVCVRVCVYACVCAHVCVSMCMCVPVCVFVRACVCLCLVSLCACLCMRSSVWPCASVYLHMYACVHVCVYMCTCVHARTNAPTFGKVLLDPLCSCFCGYRKQ